MKLLLTGALGYIGTELLFRLVHEPNLTIYAVDNDISAIKQRLGGLFKFPNFNFINADITRADEVAQIPKCDLTIHLAAIVGYVSCGNTTELSYRTNVTGTEIVASLGTPIVFLSTGSVYGEIGDVCDESVELNPKTLYAETKMLGEKIVQPLDHVILRPSTAYGLSYKVRHDLLVHTLAKTAVETGQIDLYQPQAMRSFYSVQKIAELLQFIINNYDKFSRTTLNVGCEAGNVRKIDVAKSISELTGAKIVDREGLDPDSRDYNVNFQRLNSRWSNYEESFTSQINTIVEYYQSWEKSY